MKSISYVPPRPLMTLSFVPKKRSSKISVKSGLVKTRVMASATCEKEFVR